MDNFLDTKVRIYFNNHGGVSYDVMDSILTHIYKSAQKLERDELKHYTSFMGGKNVDSVTIDAIKHRFMLVDKRKFITVTEARTGSIEIVLTAGLVSYWIVDKTLGETLKEAWKDSELNAQLMELLRRRIFNQKKCLAEMLEPQNFKSPFENSPDLWCNGGMWTNEHRERQAELARKTKRYPSDLTDAEWIAMQPLLPAPAQQGRPRQVDLREIINALRYLVRSGCGWRMLPHDFGPWQTVYWWFRKLTRRMLFATLHDVVLMLDREREGREWPSAGVIDSQSVKAPQAKQRGFDAAKKVVGRKRHIAVDTGGRLLMVNLTSADIADSTGAIAVLDALKKRWPGLKHLFADGAYDRTALLDKAAMLDFIVEIVRRHENQVGFEVLPRRWVVERTFGWMVRWRRLVRDYEQRLDTSEAMIHIAMSSLLLRRLCS